MPRERAQSASSRHAEWRDAGSDVIGATVCIAYEVRSGQTLPTDTMRVISRRHGREMAVACYLAAIYADEVASHSDAELLRVLGDRFVRLLEELP